MTENHLTETDVHKDVSHWDELPDRDQVLSHIFEALNIIATNDPFSVAKQILIKDTRFFLQTLEDSLRKHLKMVIDDEQWPEYETKPLLLSIPDHNLLDEDLMLPLFSGDSFQLSIEEEVSLKIFLMDTITPIRIHFKLVEFETNYYLKLFRITAD